MLRKGGLLLVTSTYAWSERVADRQLWLGGTRGADGEPIRCGFGCVGGGNTALGAGVVGLGSGPGCHLCAH